MTMTQENTPTPVSSLSGPDDESLWRFWNEKARKLAAKLDDLRAAVQGVDDDYMTSENHHPGYVLIPTAKFETICAALKDSPVSSLSARAAALYRGAPRLDQLADLIPDETIRAILDCKDVTAGRHKLAKALSATEKEGE